MGLKKGALISLFSILLLLFITACGTTSSDTSGKGKNKTTANSTKKVVIGVYGGEWETNIQKAALDQFAKENGIDVQVVTGADADWLTKLKAANGKNPPYDILILTPDSIERAESANLLEPLDKKKAPNLANLYQSVQKGFTFNGKVYGAGFSMGQLGIAYRKDLVKTPPKSWLDLWNSDYKGHVAISPPSYSGGLQFLAGLINAMGGDESNPKDVKAAFNKLAQLKNNIVAYPTDPGNIQTLLQRGDVWAVPFWDGRAFAMQKSGVDIGFTYPKEGAVASVTGWAIMKGSKNEENAYKLLNYLSSAKVQGAFADETYYGMSNKNTVYSDDLKNKVKVGEQYYNTLKWVNYNVAAKEVTDWTNTFTQTLGGK